MTDQHPEQLNPDGPDLGDPTLGVPGPPEELPADDAEQDEPTSVNDYEAHP